MSKEVKIILVTFVVFIAVFSPIIILTYKLTNLSAEYNKLRIQKASIYIDNRALDSLRLKAKAVKYSLDSLQTVKNKVRVKYIDKIKYVYELKNKPASLDSLTTIILYNLDSLERAGQLTAAPR